MWFENNKKKIQRVFKNILDHLYYRQTNGVLSELLSKIKLINCKFSIELVFKIKYKVLFKISKEFSRIYELFRKF